MILGAIVDKPETDPPTALALALRRLGEAHDVRIWDVAGLSAPEAIALGERVGPADLSLLKSRTPQALALARDLESRGCRVVNGGEATRDCLDRVRMGARLRRAGILRPEEWSFAASDGLLASRARFARLAFPLMVKSRRSRRDDLVGRVDDADQLHDLAERWPREPVVIQAFEANDGWDVKLWVVGRRVFAARRPSSLGAGGPKVSVPIAGELPADWERLAREVGHAFDLLVYGVDLVVTDRGPVVVDVNAFPGIRGVPGAGEALADLVERLAGTGLAPP